MLLFDHSSWPFHKRWATFVSGATLAVLALGVAERVAHGAWLGGGSWLGLPAGFAAAGLCVFEFLLWPRKWFRTLRVGRAQVWMRAHIWLGLLAVPLVLVHTGFGLHHAGRVSFGGTLTTALAVFFFAVIASGVWGLAVQQLLPRRLLEELPRETIYAQIEQVGQRLAQEAAYLVLTTWGPNRARPIPRNSKNSRSRRDRPLLPSDARCRSLRSRSAPSAQRPRSQRRSAARLSPRVRQAVSGGRGGERFALATGDTGRERVRRFAQTPAVRRTSCRRHARTPLRTAAAVRPAGPAAFLAALLAVGTFATVARPDGAARGPHRHFLDLLVTPMTPHLPPPPHTAFEETGKRRAGRIELLYYHQRDFLGRWKIHVAIVALVGSLAWLGYALFLPSWGSEFSSPVDQG